MSNSYTVWPKQVSSTEKAPQNDPENGSNILFFSGGSALRHLCQELITHTHNSTHMLTPFDSGGSTAELRKQLDIPALGDLRARITALVDPTRKDFRAITHLFSFRLIAKKDQTSAIQFIEALINNASPMIKKISSPLRQIIQEYLKTFYTDIGNYFNYDQAAIGNLILAGGYLKYGQIEPCLFELSDAMSIRGKVRLTVNENCHLVASLNNGKTLIGQHKITGKETSPIDSPIRSLHLSSSLKLNSPVQCQASEENCRLITNADLICYPPGSFYSSLLANFLPIGVSRAIYQNPNPKVYIPNLGNDPETHGLNTEESIETLVRFLSRHLSNEKTSLLKSVKLLTHVLIDHHSQYYDGYIDDNKWEELGIQIVRRDLTSDAYAPYYDPKKLTQAILSLR